MFSECSLCSVDVWQHWWTFLHRIYTIMRRVQRFYQRKTRQVTRFFIAERKRNEEEGDSDVLASANSSFDAPNIPGAVWVTQILPYLDRLSQNRLCATCKEIYETSKQFGFEGPWPQGRYRFKRPILRVAFSPDTSSLAIVPASSKTIVVWNRRHGMDQTLKGHSGIVSDVTFSSKGGLLASCSRTDGTVRIWSKQEDTTGDRRGEAQYKCTRRLILRVFAMRYLRFSPCEEMIAVSGQDRMIRLERIDSGTPSNVGSVPWRSRIGIKCLENMVFPKRSNRNILAFAFNNEHVRLWNWGTQTTMELRDAERTIAVGDYDAYVTAMSVVDLNTSDGRSKEYLVVGCHVATVKLWDLTDYSCVRSFRLGNGWSAVTNIAFAQNGTRMACTGDGSQIRVFDVERTECIAVLKDNKDRVESLSFSPDGETLASGALDRTLHLWSLPCFLEEQRS